MSGAHRHTVEYVHHGIAYDDWARRLVEEFEYACEKRKIDARTYGIRIELENGGSHARVTGKGHPLFPSAKFDGIYLREDGSGMKARDGRVFDTLKVLERRQQGLDASGLERPPAWSFWGDAETSAIMSSYEMSDDDLAKMLSPSAEKRLWVAPEGGVEGWFERGPTSLTMIEMRIPGVTLYGSSLHGSNWVKIDGTMPETICISAIGRPLAEVIGHKAFHAMKDAKVTEVFNKDGSTIMEYEQRDRIELQPVPDDVSPLDPLLARVDRRDEPS